MRFPLIAPLSGINSEGLQSWLGGLASLAFGGLGCFCGWLCLWAIFISVCFPCHATGLDAGQRLRCTASSPVEKLPAHLSKPTMEHLLARQSDRCDPDGDYTASASLSRDVDGHLSMGNHEDSVENNRQVNSLLELALHDDHAALFYEAELEEIVIELIQCRVIRQSCSLLHFALCDVGSVKLACLL